MTQDNNANDETKEYKNLKQALSNRMTASNRTAPNRTTASDRKTVSDRTAASKPSLLQERSAVRSSKPAASGESKLRATASASDGKDAKNASDKPAASKRKRMPIGLRILWQTVRILFVPALCAVALYLGLRVGYVTFGEQNPEDIWEFRTWKHLYDLVFSDNP